ncbi:RsmD family RNA methyltransferase [Pricia sp. S334]|uniref:RsmD family RNA methyltransferase n=1 Tax=Pricia mediterranea TaxID=3076079 RepID=A0ABU3L1J8_9FLAO|nr:RsmD family RNA methyltransferase [Pricia sp. S334]MDT7827297.1 RsmD family RNA methyltransferase [Pricia sp. S334]
MRIISGTYKGKRIVAPKKLPVRPTTDMAKEALFNILNNRYYFSDIAVLDLFAGTGNISYEFASRGTDRITAVDVDSACIRFIDSISEEMDLDISALKSDVFDYLAKTGARVDIIFADPFYEMSQTDFQKLVSLTFDRNLLLQDGTLIIEHSSRMDLSELHNFTEKRKYGGTAFSFFNEG